MSGSDGLDDFVTRLIAAAPNARPKILHQFHSENLVFHLQHGSRQSVLLALKQLDRLDGKPFKLLIQQLDGSVPAKPKFRNRFKIVSSKGKAPHPASRDADLRAIIRKEYDQLVQKGVNKKNIFETMYKWHGLGRTKLLELLAQPDDSK